MPLGAKILTLQLQDETPCFWAEVDTDASTEQRLFRILGTGHPLPEGLTYLGTFQLPPFVWHVYEEPP